MSGRRQEDEDDWETDPDYDNTMTEEQQRWGGARDTGVLDMDKLRETVMEEDKKGMEQRSGEDGYRYSDGYGGQFGVLEDRQDKSAVGWDYRSNSDSHQNNSYNKDQVHAEKSEQQSEKNN